MKICPHFLSPSPLPRHGDPRIQRFVLPWPDKNRKKSSHYVIQKSSRNRQKFCILLYRDKKAFKEQPRLAGAKIPKSLSWLSVALLGLEPGSRVPTLSGVWVSVPCTFVPKVLSVWECTFIFLGVIDNFDSAWNVFLAHSSQTHELTDIFFRVISSLHIEKVFEMALCGSVPSGFTCLTLWDNTIPTWSCASCLCGQGQFGLKYGAHGEIYGLIFWH